LEEAGAARAAALIAVSTYSDVNLTVCQIASSTFGIPSLISLTREPDVAAQMAELGVRVVQPQMATAHALEGALHFPGAFDMLTDHVDGIEVREVELSSRRWSGKRVREITLPGNALILGLRRKGEVLVPDGNTKLQRGDLLMLVGHPDALQSAINLLSQMRMRRPVAASK
jgi:Trk K+ transport system NAD-binding subunit